jgi:hypothetical protein
MSRDSMSGGCWCLWGGRGCGVERGACACPKLKSLEAATDNGRVDEQVNLGPETSRVCNRAGSAQTVCRVEGANEEKRD